MSEDNKSENLKNEESKALEDKNTKVTIPKPESNKNVEGKKDIEEAVPPKKDEFKQKKEIGLAKEDPKKAGQKDDENKKLKQKTLTSQTKVTEARSKKNIDNEKKSSESRQNQLDQNEFVEKLVSINRVAKVVKGGRRFSFAALVVVGDGNGMVGHGKGKAKEVPEAIKKATDEAKSKMIRVPLRQGRTLHHDIKGRFDSGKVYLRSAPSGTGVIAGGPMRAVFEALGIQDIVAKSVGTSNPHNMVRATFEALKSASSPKIIAMRRGLKINDITKRRKNATGNDNVKN